MRNGVSRVVWREQPNGLGISGGASIERDHVVANSVFQKSSDLGGAERRPLHARVGRQLGRFVLKLACNAKISLLNLAAQQIR